MSEQGEILKKTSQGGTHQGFGPTDDPQQQQGSKSESRCDYLILSQRRGKKAEADKSAAGQQEAQIATHNGGPRGIGEGLQ